MHPKERHQDQIRTYHSSKELFSSLLHQIFGSDALHSRHSTHANTLNLQGQRSSYSRCSTNIALKTASNLLRHLRSQSSTSYYDICLIMDCYKLLNKHNYQSSKFFLNFLIIAYLKATECS